MMIKFVKLIVLLMTLVAIGVGQSKNNVSTKLQLGHVPDADFGCGCYFFRSKVDHPNRRYLLVEPMDEPAYINLNGKTIRLHSVSSSKENRNERIGDRSWESYSGDGVSIRIDSVVTSICDPNDENCESTQYKTRMAVRRGKQIIVVNGFGVCGC
jgi:hypothetical protein